MSQQAAPEPAAADHRMRNTIIGIGLVIIAIAAAAALAWGAGGGPAGSRTPPAAAVSYTPVTHTVSYEADGDGTDAGSYTIQAPDGTRQGNADLPLMNKAGGTGLQFTGFGPGDFVYLSIQNSNGWGSVTCRIVVDGVTISENTSSGGYTIATCQGRVP